MSHPASNGPLIFLLAILLTGPALAQVDRLEPVTGVLDQLDLVQGKGRITTDLGKPIFFEVVKPELFQPLTVGQRITVELDAEGRAVKVIAVPPPELDKPVS
jgi:hypothetical protein